MGTLSTSLRNFASNKWAWVAVAALLAVYYFGDTVDVAVQAASGDDAFTQWDSLFQSNGSAYSVPWRWLKAICMNESNLGQAKSVALGIQTPADVTGSISSDGLSWGLMQLTLATARALEGAQIQAPYLNDPGNSVRLGAELVKQLIGTFGIADRESVVRAYNGGHFGVASVPYYTKFVANLAVVMNSQPGDELEFSP